MAQTWTVRDVLEWTTGRLSKQGMESPRLDAEVLLAHSLGVERIRLYMDNAKPLTREELAIYRTLVRRRLRFEPIAYITGRREFWSLDFEVNPDVLVPRPDTETLVEQAGLSLECNPRATVVDVGTGSGAIAVALGHQYPEARVIGVEVSAAALAVARRNVGRHAPQVALVQGDLLGAFAPLSMDIVVANLPYLPAAAQLPADVGEWEPPVALFGGDDGLDFVRPLVEQARAVLRPGGAIALELDSTQITPVMGLLERSGYGQVVQIFDLSGLPRVVRAKRLSQI